MTPAHDTEQASPPLPEPDADTAGFWEAAKRHELAIQRCRGCRRFQHFPGPICSSCGSDDLAFEAVSGLGTVYSFVTVHHVVIPAFADRAPYVVAWIELPEQRGLRVLSDLVECDPDGIAIGAAVEVMFDDVTQDVTVPRFRPVSQ